MKSLLSELDASTGKIAYQAYIIQHGIEQIEVLIPLKGALTFEEDFNSSTDKTKATLLEIVRQHSGKIRGV